MQLVVPNSIGCVLDNIIGSHYTLLLFVLNVLCFLTVSCAIIPFVVNLCISRVPLVISRLATMRSEIAVFMAMKKVHGFFNTFSWDFHENDICSVKIGIFGRFLPE